MFAVTRVVWPESTTIPSPLIMQLCTHISSMSISTSCSSLCTGVKTASSTVPIFHAPLPPAMHSVSRSVTISFSLQNLVLCFFQGHAQNPNHKCIPSDKARLDEAVYQYLQEAPGMGTHRQPCLFRAMFDRLRIYEDYREACFASLDYVGRPSLREMVRDHWTTFWSNKCVEPWPSFDESLRLYRVTKKFRNSKMSLLPPFRMWDLWTAERLADYRTLYWLPDA